MNRYCDFQDGDHILHTNHIMATVRGAEFDCRCSPYHSSYHEPTLINPMEKEGNQSIHQAAEDQHLCEINKLRGMMRRVRQIQGRNIGTPELTHVPMFFYILQAIQLMNKNVQSFLINQCQQIPIYYSH